MEIKECASSRFKDDNKEKAKHVDAPCENKRHAGSTPATSTIYRSNNGASRPMELLLSDYCQRIEYPEGSGIIIKKVLNSCCRTQYNDSFQVYIPEKVTGYKRIRKQFKQLGAAIDYAELAIKGQKRIGELFYQISPMVFYDFANGRLGLFSLAKL